MSSEISGFRECVRHSIGLGISQGFAHQYVEGRGEEFSVTWMPNRLMLRGTRTAIWMSSPKKAIDVEFRPAAQLRRRSVRMPFDRLRRFASFLQRSHQLRLVCRPPTIFG